MNYANCPVAKYHNFRVLASPYLPEKQATKQIEQCRACGKREEYSYKPDGKMVNERKYFLDHIRAFAQPFMGEVYWECNPGAFEKFTAKEAEDKKREIKNLERDEHFKFAIKRAFEDRDDGIKK